MGVLRRLGSATGAVFSATIVASVLTGGAAQAATTYVVDNTSTSCSDTGAGAGSPTQPFCTIAAAAAKAVAGNTVQVNGGPYSGASVDPANSGTAGNPITFTASPGVTISGGTRGFSISSRNYIVINGFTVTGTSSYGIYVAGGSNDAVTNNTISSAGLPVAGSAMVGIYINGLTGGTVSGNVTYDNSAHGIQLTTTTTSVAVQGNTSYHNAYQYQRVAAGVYVQGPGNSLIGNVTYGNEDSGIEVDTSANNTLIADNVSYGNGDHGIDNRNVTGGRVTGNTVYLNCTDGINVEGTASSYVIENNIAVDNATGVIINPTPINPPGAYTNACNRRTGNIGVYDSAPATSTANYNLVWQDGAGVEYEWGGTSYPSQAALNTATGQEAHGIFADPKFVNAAKFDLQLTEGSPAIDSADSGAPGEQATDILGNPRVNDPATPNTGAGPRTYDDRGAYELQSSAPLIGPTAHVTVSPGSGTAPLTVKADASGSTAGSLPITGYTIDYGDGTTVGPQTAATASHIYTTAGTYTVTVTVTDANDLTSAASQAVTAAPPGIAVGAEGTDGAMYVQAPQLTPGWHSLGGKIAGPPAVAAPPNANGSSLASPLFVATGTDKLLYMRSLSIGWQQLGPRTGSCLGSPAAVITGTAPNYTVTVACEGTNLALWENRSALWSGSGLPQFTSGWTSLGGVLTAGPAVAPVGGTLTFFVRGTTGKIYTRTLANGYTATPWACIGSPAAALQPSAGVTYFACQGTDHQLYEATSSGGAWSAAQALGQSLIGGPAVAATAGTAYLLAEFSNHAVGERTPTTGWVSLGGAVVGGVGASALN